MDDLLIKYILEEATPEESAQVQQWLAADAANRARFEKLQATWQLATQPSLQLTTNTPQALQRLKQTLRTKQTAPVKRIWTRVGTAAAAVVGFAGVVLGAYVVLKPKPPVKKTIPIVQPDTGMQKRIPVDTLPVTPTDTIPVVKPHKKKPPVPATPAQPVRPKKKVIQPIQPVDSIQPVPVQTLHTVPAMKRTRPRPELIIDTALIKRKHARPTQPASPVKKHKSVIMPPGESGY
jgi:hypothetical protein